MKNKIKEFTLYMKELGAVKPENAYNDLQWHIDTKFGPLEISIHERDFTSTGKPRKKYNNLVQIYSRFKDERCEPFLQEYEGKKFITSYKWNHSCSGGEDEIETWDYCFQRFKNDLDKILVKN